MDIINHRSGLSNLKSAISDRDSIRIGYIGGSITDETAKHNWPEYVSAWVKDTYPDKRVYAENIGIGGTGSALAVFRFDWELADKNCDLIFIEFAVNDIFDDADHRMRTREGLVRKIMNNTSADIVFVYTYMHELYDDMMAGRVPDTIAEFEQLAEHYGIGSVWMAKNAFDTMTRGLVRFEEWLPDNLHPQSTGSRLYAAPVIEYLAAELDDTTPAMDRSISPLHLQNWENARVLPFEEINTHGMWLIKSMYTRDVRYALYTASTTATLSFSCKCKTVTMCRLFGSGCCELVKYRVNGGEWQTDKREALEWMGASGWMYQIDLADGDEEQDYFIEIRGEKAAVGGSSLYITHIGIV